MLRRALPAQARRDGRRLCTRRSAIDCQWPSPRGGFFLWATLPGRIDADGCWPRAVDHGVIYVAGEAFFVDGSGQNLVRLSFSAPTPERIREGVRRLGTAVAAELEAVTRGGCGIGTASPGKRRERLRLESQGPARASATR